MSRLSGWAILVACVGVTFMAGCGGDKKDPVSSEGTGHFKPGLYHTTISLSGTGSTSLCSAVPVQTTSLDTTICDLGSFTFGIDLPDSCAEVTDKTIHVDCRAPLDYDGCLINFHFVGDGKIDSTDYSLTVVGSIESLANTPACEPLIGFPCNLKFTITGQRTGNAPGAGCAGTEAEYEGAAGILGVPWQELKPRAR